MAGPKHDLTRTIIAHGLTQDREYETGQTVIYVPEDCPRHSEKWTIEKFRGGMAVCGFRGDFSTSSGGARTRDKKQTGRIFHDEAEHGEFLRHLDWMGLTHWMKVNSRQPHDQLTSRQIQSILSTLKDPANG